MDLLKNFKIQFVPFKVPFQRRLQTFGVCFFLFTFLHMFSLIGTSILFALLFTPFFWVPLLYIAFYVYDFNTCEKGGYGFQFLRKLFIWKYFRDYFPVTLNKTVDLDPSRNYLFCAHPHGIMCCGLFCALGTDSCEFSGKFPGLTPHLLTLKANFYCPISREHNLMNGTCVASNTCLDYILSNRGNCKQSGQVCILVVGGAEEALDVHPNTYTLTLKNRKGFVRAALRNGAALVPVFSFGENDVYSTISFEPGSKLRVIQEKLKKLTSIGFPIIWGRGIFNYTFGALPHRKPINIVVGKPIDVPKIPTPTQEQVDEYHAIYINSLIELFEEHKEKYVEDRNAKLILK